ncbi:hypothetical protein RM553_03945 [Zunongwangia sp. F363]|uniref:Histone deacetylase n=1 Tax=Autumnicola tepida TaxID=3075595 RepID=A0ABU3C6K8_9FLAO|nr:hypothetical protein [Zunongwangia sp. F363]MDT0641976.1 hypothetical protein [Zunongwangia sp. F363]
MEEETNEVWYACYGSNIREKRFLCYIEGGTPEGAVRNFAGCTNPAAPKENHPVEIKRELYFAKESVTWNGGGIGFLKPEEKSSSATLGRQYLITSDQFVELVKQELKMEGELSINFEELVENGSYICSPGGRYGQLVCLGHRDGKPIFTFTSEHYLEEEINPPNKAYVSTIISGLREIYDLSDKDLLEYFSNKTGIKNTPLESQLPEIIAAAH